MQFGLHLTLSERYSPGANMAKSLREAAYLVGLARDYGFDAIMSDEHMLAYPNQRPATIPALSYLAAVSEGMLVGSTVLLLPLHPPVQVAEDFAALDAMTNGRAILGVGMGYREVEFSAFGINPKERVGRVYESLDLIKRLWTQEEVEFNGKYFQVPKVIPTAKPVQQPHPPIWIGVTSDAPVRRVAKNGYTWLMACGKDLKTLAMQSTIYKDTLLEHGHSLPAIRPMRTDVYLSEDSSLAWKEAEPLLTSHDGVLNQWRQDLSSTNEAADIGFLEYISQKNNAVGTPDEVIKKLEMCERLLGVNFMDVRLHYVGMSIEEKVRQLRLFGEGVIPHFKKRRMENF